MNIPLVRSCALWLLLSALVAAHAADDALTLDDAVALALSSAPQIAAKLSAIDGAQAMTASAGRLPDPELVFGVDNLPTNGSDAYSFGNDFMTMRKVGVMQTFPSARRREAERLRAQAFLSVAESDTAQTRLETAQSTADAWVSAHAAQVVLRGLQQLKPEIDLQAEAARVAVAGGRTTAFEAVSAQLAVADLGDRLMQAQREVATTRTELRRHSNSSS